MAHDILIVDDEADIRMLIGGILEDEGHQTRGAADCDEALDGDSHAQAHPGDPRHLAAGQQDGRASSCST